MAGIVLAIVLVDMLKLSIITGHDGEYACGDLKAIIFNLGTYATLNKS